ncbi:hypothetical protein BRADI_5g08460v3 [Brachypodium distachyon]|uniref:Nudix hydrolase domain-containing protein n=1 Tax=Brachypodium distachyon TaxID=15368 RepID=A0A2K2CFY5_BRADI|nr:hypothetical protein BRADI_5g08460v3 [Brachypodium distachyon]
MNQNIQQYFVGLNTMHVDCLLFAQHQFKQSSSVGDMRNSLGLWVFRSKSSQSESGDSPRGACKGQVFALEVTEELEQWPEQDTHGRRWVSPADAYGLCRYDWMREALTALLDRCSMSSASAIPAPASELNEHAGTCMNMTLMKPTATADRAVALC